MVKLVFITDVVNGEQQEKNFRNKHSKDEIVVVKNPDELKDAVKKYKNRLNNEVYLPSVLTPVSIESALRLSK